MPRSPSILIALSLLSSLAAAAEPSSQPSAESTAVRKDGVAITVLLPRPILPADCQPRFAVRFKNTTADYINLYDVNAFWDWQFQFISTDKHAADPGPWQLRMDKLANRYPIAYKQIKARESLEVPIDLNDPPFTFDFVYAGPMDHLVAPVRQLNAGTYQLTINISLPNPFGRGYHVWTGPLTTDPVEFTVGQRRSDEEQSHPTTQQLAAYDIAINRVTDKLDPNGLWTNGISPVIPLPPNANPEDIIARAVNASLVDGKAYRILRVRPMDHLPSDGTAALLWIGTRPRLLIFSPEGKLGWWSRFYDTDLAPSTTQPTAS
jgi:hypothetical protein